jgi:DNA-3-methyladenine glycosylase II
MSAEILAHLSKADPVMRQLVRRVGPLTLQPDKRRTPFQSLVRAVANQQLNGKAAETILGRFIALFPGRRFPLPEDLAGVDDDRLRACGFSRAKVAAIRDIAAKSLSGVIPNSRQIARLSDDAIVERLTEARGVGRWTVEMLLIFQLGRPDVLPVDDFGVRNGYRLAYRHGEMPKPKELLVIGEKWRPHRSAASWYLWRATELDWDV